MQKELKRLTVKSHMLKIALFIIKTNVEEIIKNYASMKQGEWYEMDRSGTNFPDPKNANFNTCFFFGFFCFCFFLTKINHTKTFI